MFESFFLAGFEGTNARNLQRQLIDHVEATHHDRLADEDYYLLRKAGIRAAREVIRWRMADRLGRYDFSSVRPFVEAGRKHGIKIIFDLFHFDYPDGIDLLSDEFPARFADYCYAAALYVAANTEGECYFIPVNEPSYFAWAAGDAGLLAPYLYGKGWELKVALVRAAIRGIDAIRAACPRARIINTDPVCRAVPPADRPDLQGEADAFNSSVVFEGWDMLSGSLLPELGGSPSHLDIVGVNYYWAYQWEFARENAPLRPGDPRRWPLGRLVRTVWERYGRDVLITETGHAGEMRAAWLREVADEAESLLDEGVPLRGACLYPIIGLPEWLGKGEWSRMGLWELVSAGDRLERVAHEPALEALREAQQRLERGRSDWNRLGRGRPGWQQARAASLLPGVARREQALSSSAD